MLLITWRSYGSLPGTERRPGRGAAPPGRAAGSAGAAPDAQLLDKLRENRFNLVILGAFKRGKSTLINALMGEAVLPTSIIPLTSVVTILGYGERLEIRVPFSKRPNHRDYPGGIGGLYHREGQSQGP